MSEALEPRAELPVLDVPDVTWAFDNAFVRNLPADPDTDPQRRRQVRDACYSHAQPTATAAPQWVAWSADAAALLDLPAQPPSPDALVRVLSGNALLPGMQAYATCYGGHQFGNWAGQLGDGRAINLGEIVNRAGDRWAIQLKGAGPTPYSRTADGLAVLRSSVREFLCSEAMHWLGVPTTRALSLCLTGDQVLRDMLYDGNAALEPGAVVCRLAPSFTRFGHFQMIAARGETELLARFFDYTLSHDFPELAEQLAGRPRSEQVVAWFQEVASRTARLVVHWMRVGFVHGVLNTDNMSVLGQTIDYGPYGWLEDYDPNWTPNTTDAQGRRYRFGWQPAVAQWNLNQLGNALVPLAQSTDPLAEVLQGFEQEYVSLWRAMMGTKLGLRDVEQADSALFEALDTMLQRTETDMTRFYRQLAELPVVDAPLPDNPVGRLSDAFYAPDELTGDLRDAWNGWLADWAARIARDARPDSERQAAMNAVNPKYVLRNYLAQLAIDAAEQGDFDEVNTLLEVLRRPYDEQPEYERYAALRPDWARTRVGCSMLSCSS